jgi:hypothetical protein
MRVQLENKEQAIERLETHSKVLQQKIKTVEPRANEAEQYRIEKEKSDAEIERLKAELQAKAAKKLELAAVEHRQLGETANTVEAAPLPAEPVQTAVYADGSKESWMSAAGIPESEWGYVDSIVFRESGWNPNAVNPNGGACGLGQQLPCGKWDNYGAWNDPVAALRAQHDYVVARYGGYPQAVAFWNIHHWY